MRYETQLLHRAVARVALPRQLRSEAFRVALQRPGGQGPRSEFLGRYSQSLTRWLVHRWDRHDLKAEVPELPTSGNSTGPCPPRANPTADPVVRYVEGSRCFSAAPSITVPYSRRDRADRVQHRPAARASRPRLRAALGAGRYRPRIPARAGRWRDRRRLPAR